jgi:TPR repeat protein
MQGSSTAMMNVAAAYRLLGNSRQTFRWYKKAADLDDGDALAEVGYCIQHGVGTKPSARSAQRAYRAAIASRQITQFAREEAMYNLAVLLSFRRSPAALREARRLLRRANADQDYSQAEVLLETLSAGGDRICVCRRGLRRHLAVARCRLHGHSAGQPGIAAAGRAKPNGNSRRRGRAPAAERRSR